MELLEDRCDLHYHHVCLLHSQLLGSEVIDVDQVPHLHWHLPWRTFWVHCCLVTVSCRLHQFSLLWFDLDVVRPVELLFGCLVTLFAFGKSKSRHIAQKG